MRQVTAMLWDGLWVPSWAVWNSFHRERSVVCNLWDGNWGQWSQDRRQSHRGFTTHLPPGGTAACSFHLPSTPGLPFSFETSHWLWFCPWTDFWWNPFNPLIFFLFLSCAAQMPASLSQRSASGCDALVQDRRCMPDSEDAQIPYRKWYSTKHSYTEFTLKSIPSITFLDLLRNFCIDFTQSIYGIAHSIRPMNWE